MARKKDHKGYLWIPKVSTNDCIKEYYAGVESGMKKWCANTTNHIEQKDYEKFMKGKPEYTCEELLQKVPKEYHSVIDIFMKRDTDMLPEHQNKDHRIQLEEGKNPLFVQNYRPLSDQENNAMIKYIQEHLGKNFIWLSLLAAAAPILLVKKPERELYFCVDYCALNAVTIKNRYPIPLINKTLGKLMNVVRFTKLNIIAAFNRIRIKEGQKWLIAFNTRYSQFEYRVMPCGLCNALKPFQNYINNSLREYLDVFCTAYLNDVLVYSTKEEKYTGHVLDVLKWLRDRDLQVNVSKCKFSVTWVKDLGLIVSTNGIKMDPEKVHCILN